LKAVSNSVALIHIFKSNSQSILSASFNKLWISPWVFEEVVVKGKEGGHIDAFHIEENMGKLIEVKKLNKKHRELAKGIQKSGLGRGEAETISLAKQLNVPALLDEKGARRVAEYVGISYFGVLGLLVRLKRKGKISTEEAKEVVARLVQSGYRISTSVYLLFTESIEE